MRGCPAEELLSFYSCGGLSGNAWGVTWLEARQQVRGNARSFAWLKEMQQLGCAEMRGALVDQDNVRLGTEMFGAFGDSGATNTMHRPAGLA